MKNNRRKRKYAAAVLSAAALAAALSGCASPVEETAGQVYDSFLKGNGQKLGMRSYGACVDLLVAYFGT